MLCLALAVALTLSLLALCCVLPALRERSLQTLLPDAEITAVFITGTRGTGDALLNQSWTTRETLEPFSRWAAQVRLRRASGPFAAQDTEQTPAIYDVTVCMAQARSGFRVTSCGMLQAENGLLYRIVSGDGFETLLSAAPKP